MKKQVLASLLLATLLLGACAGKKEDKAAVEVGEQVSITQVAANVKDKYDDSEVSYTGENILLARDEKIKLEIGFNPTDLGMENFTEIVEIFQDSALTQSLGTHFNMDKETTFIEVLPPRSAVLPISQINVHKKDHGYEGANLLLFEQEENADWGNLPQLYMEVKVDLKTGKALEKPLVTPLTISHEVNGDLRLKLAINEEGLPEFSWNELSGADYYYLMDVDYKKDKGLTGLGVVREKISDGTSFVAEPGAAFTTFKVSEQARQEKENIKEYGEGTEAIQKETDTERQFAVVAVSKDGTSAISNTLSLKDLAKRIPYTEEIAKSNEEEGGTTAPEIGLLPSYRWVTMSDGSLVQKLINYDISKAKEDTQLWASYEKEDMSDLEAHEVELITIPYTVEGTPFEGKARVENYYVETWQDELKVLEERQNQLRNKAGTPQVEMTSEEVEATQETQNSTAESQTTTSETNAKEEETSSSTTTTETSSSERRRRKTKNSSSEETKDSSSSTTTETSETTASSQTRRRKQETEESTSATNEKTQQDKNQQSEETISESTDQITANSALSEFLAINMLDGKTLIDIQEFPEALSQETLFDAWMEAIYQNPLILGVEGAQIIGYGQMLQVTYNVDAVEMKEKQAELREEVKKVVAEIIKPEMTDLEKEFAINNYLIEVAEYDDAALENAEKNDFVKVDEEFNDAFTPYGVLIDKVGVCASYAGAFKLLADEADLEAIVVTGYLDGDLPHAWNKVKIEDQWHVLDSTNNDNDLLLNALLNIPGTASSKILVEDDRYVLDTHLENYTASDDDQAIEYYHVENKFYSSDKIVAELVETLENEGSVSLRTAYDLTDEQFAQIGAEVMEKTKDKDLQGFYWMGVIYLLGSK